MHKLSLKGIEKLTLLERLSIEHVGDIIDLKPLRKCTNLRELYLKSLAVEELDLSHLSECKYLHTIDVRYIYNMCWIKLPKMDEHEHFKTLIIKGDCEKRDMNESVHSHSKIDLSLLAGCKSIQKIDLRRNPTLKNLDLTPLGGLTSLEFLDISLSCSYDEIDLSSLGTCESLTMLYIQNDTNKKKDESHELDITSLFKLMNLEYVLFFKTFFNDHIEYDKSLGREDVLNHYYTYINPGRTIRHWLEEGIVPYNTQVSVVQPDVKVEVEPLILTKSIISMGEGSPGWNEQEIEREPLTPRLKADSSVVPESARRPKWAKAYEIEWY